MVIHDSPLGRLLPWALGSGCQGPALDVKEFLGAALGFHGLSRLPVGAELGLGDAPTWDDMK